MKYMNKFKNTLIEIAFDVVLKIKKYPKGYNQ